MLIKRKLFYFLCDYCIVPYLQKHKSPSGKDDLGQDLFDCLFDWASKSHSRILNSYGDVTITAEELQILTFLDVYSH